MAEGDFVVVTRGEPHLIYSDRRTKPLPVLDLDRIARTLSAWFVTAAARSRFRQ